MVREQFKTFVFRRELSPKLANSDFRHLYTGLEDIYFLRELGLTTTHDSRFRLLFQSNRFCLCASLVLWPPHQYFRNGRIRASGKILKFELNIVCCPRNKLRASGEHEFYLSKWRALSMPLGTALPFASSHAGQLKTVGVDGDRWMECVLYWVSKGSYSCLAVWRANGSTARTYLPL